MTSPARILTAAEPWTEYQLDDGTLLRFRLTACNFHKTGKTTPQGDPEYSFTHHIQCETHAPKRVGSLQLLRDAKAWGDGSYTAPPDDAG